MIFNTYLLRPAWVKIVTLSLFLTFFFGFLPGFLFGSSSELEVSVAALKKKPNDQALREKIIQLARESKPDMPEEAKKFIARAKAAVENKENGDAVKEYQKALLAAPWMGDAYYNLGTLQQATEDYKGAMKSFKLYILASPEASDAEKVKENIYKLEYKAEKQGRVLKIGKKGKSIKNNTGGSGDPFLVFLRQNEGAVFRLTGTTCEVRIENGEVVNGGCGPIHHYSIKSFTSTVTYNVPANPPYSFPETYVFSPDGKTVTESFVQSTGEKQVNVYRRVN